MFSPFAAVARWAAADRRSACRARSVVRWALLLAVGIVSAIAHRDAAAVSGHVYSHATGQPLGGITVRVWYPNLWIDVNLALLTTAADGSFAWEGECEPPERICHIDINDDRYLYSDLTFSEMGGDAIVDFNLVSTSTIAGALRIDGLETTEAIEVTASYQSDENDGWSGAVSVFEQDGGHYSLSRLPPGVPYRICARGANTIEQCFDHHDRTSSSIDPEFDLISVGEGDRRDDIDFDLASGGSIGGTLHDAYLSIPLANTELDLTLVDENGDWLGAAVGLTDDDGRYRFRGLLDGSFYVIANIGGFDGPFVEGTQLYPDIVCEDNTCPPATDGQRLTILDGSSLDSIDFTVHPATVIRGRVTDSSTGLGMGGVSIYRSGDFRPAAVSADASGDYIFYTGSLHVPFRILTKDTQPYIEQVFPDMPYIGHLPSDAGRVLHRPQATFTRTSISRWIWAPPSRARFTTRRHRCRASA